MGATLSGVLVLGLIFSILNFENGLDTFTLSAYWQAVIRGIFLLIVVALQSTFMSRQEKAKADVNNKAPVSGF